MSPAPRPPERFRERFPIFERKVFLNSCSQGALSEPESRGPLVVLGCSDAPRLVQALARENLVVSARGAGLRVSFHYYNLPEDVEALLRVLERNQELIAGVESRR